jgi:hypothetical protein
MQAIGFISGVRFLDYSPCLRGNSRVRSGGIVRVRPAGPRMVEREISKGSACKISDCGIDDNCGSSREPHRGCPPHCRCSDIVLPRVAERNCSNQVVLQGMPTLLRSIPLCREMMAEPRGFSAAGSGDSVTTLLSSFSRSAIEVEQASHSQKYSTVFESRVRLSDDLSAGSASSRKSLPSDM